MLAGKGSIPAEIPPQITELDTVGATANKWVFLIPVPLHHNGSPYSWANAIDAFSALPLISENMLWVWAVDAIELNGNPFCCKNECHPITPKPKARPFLAWECVLFKLSLPLDLSINSCITPSKNHVANSTASVSFHSSYLAKFIDDKQHINECSSSVNNVISEHMLVILTSKLFNL